MKMDKEKELPKRKDPRLKGFDYSKTGSYFLTICTQNRKNILGAIVGEGSDLPRLSPYGEIVDGWIQKIPEKYPETAVDCYVIMPNHIHILLSIVRDDGRGNPSPTDTRTNFGRDIVFSADLCYNGVGDENGRVEKSQEHSVEGCGL